MRTKVCGGPFASTLLSSQCCAMPLLSAAHFLTRTSTHLFREFVAVHAGLKAVAKVNVQQLARVAVQHEV